MARKTDGARKSRRLGARGLWSPEEDRRLLECVVDKIGTFKWTEVPKLAGLQRCGKSCRLRWLNYLKPGLNHAGFTQEEESLIIRMHCVVGNRWSLIASMLVGRTDNQIKNFWNLTIRRKLRDGKIHHKTPVQQQDHETDSTVSPSAGGASGSGTMADQETMPVLPSAEGVSSYGTMADQPEGQLNFAAPVAHSGNTKVDMNYHQTDQQLVLEEDVAFWESLDISEADPSCCFGF